MALVRWALPDTPWAASPRDLCSGEMCSQGLFFCFQHEAPAGHPGCVRGCHFYHILSAGTQPCRSRAGGDLGLRGRPPAPHSSEQTRGGRSYTTARLAPIGSQGAERLISGVPCGSPSPEGRSPPALAWILPTQIPAVTPL